MTSTKNPTVRQINDRLWCGQGYCYITFDNRCIRVSRVRTVKGTLQGRVINGAEPMTWATIPAHARIELS